MYKSSRNDYFYTPSTRIRQILRKVVKNYTLTSILPKSIYCYIQYTNMKINRNDNNNKTSADRIQKVAIVTGSSSGIGRTTAIALAKEVIKL